jgi:hypothetical protein
VNIGWHEDALQNVPFAQTVPQPPQLSGSVLVGTQAPLHGEKPLAQTHVPPSQLWPPPHGWPQVPQLSASLAVVAHVPPHKSDPGGQLQPASAQVPPLHPLPQAPQLDGLVWRSTHAPLQNVSPLGQTHWAPTQSRPPPHAAPQALQFSGSVVTSVHPLLHSCLPPMQGFATHAPITHASLAEHARPQAPQLPTSEPRSAQLPQSVLPAGQRQTPPAQLLPVAHATPTQSRGAQALFWQTDSGSQVIEPQSLGKHAPPAQAVLAGHAVPQVPQLAESVMSAAQLPPHTLSPGGHVQRPAMQARPGAQITPTQARSTHMFW